MKRGFKALLITASLLATDCTGSSNNIKIRAVGDAAQPRPANEQVAYGRAQLRLGSPGLALEAFRRAAREQPENVDALAGIADAYTAMGRRDLARRYYEAALAVAPRDQALLRAVDTPAAVPSAAATVTMTLPPAKPPQISEDAAVAPRLERLSPGEVALVTTARPIWQAVVVSRTRVSTTLRWVPIRSVSSQPQIRLLNAARQQGIAAQTRRILFAQGWRKLAIGDAPRIRATSLILYPAGREAAARMLSTHLRIEATGGTRGDVIVVLLGRDATRDKLEVAG